MRRIGNRYTDQPRNHALFFNSTTPANPPSSRSHRKTEDTPPSKYLHTYIFIFILRCDHGQCATTTLSVSRETGSHGFGGCGGRRGRGGGGGVEKAQRLFSYQRPVWGEIEIERSWGLTSRGTYRTPHLLRSRVCAASEGAQARPLTADHIRSTTVTWRQKRNRGEVNHTGPPQPTEPHRLLKPAGRGRSVTHL